MAFYPGLQDFFGLFLQLQRGVSAASARAIAENRITVNASRLDAFVVHFFINFYLLKGVEI
jgi:hypothetical protein